MKRKFPKYLDWVRTQNCVCCGDYAPSEPHHLIGEFNQSGAGLKAPDCLSMPMCRPCHRSIHEAAPNWKDLQREALIRTLIRAFEEGMITVNEGD